jgi:hypothetical protein
VGWPPYKHVSFIFPAIGVPSGCAGFAGKFPSAGEVTALVIRRIEDILAPAKRPDAISLTQ